MPLAYSQIIHRETRNIEELLDNRPTKMTKPLSWRTERNMVSAEIPVYRYRCRKWSSFYSTPNHIVEVPQVNHKSLHEKQNTLPGFCCSKQLCELANSKTFAKKKQAQNVPAQRFFDPAGRYDHNNQYSARLDYWFRQSVHVNCTEMIPKHQINYLSTAQKKHGNWS